MKRLFPIGVGRLGAAGPPQAGRGRRRARPLVRAAALALLTAALVALAWRLYGGRTVAPAPLSAPVAWGNLDINIESSGTVRPARSVELAFPAGGQVREVLVEPGARVSAGQPLARLDDRELRLAVQQAEADLRSASAALDAASNGSATPQDITRAEADLRARLAELERVRTGNVTAADIREAEASLNAALARMDALRSPAQDKLSSAQAGLAQAQANLQQVRDGASAEKTGAQLALEQAAADLTRAQASYSEAKSIWDYVSSTGKSPDQPTSAGQAAPGLSDVERQRYYSAYVQAEASLRYAEDAVARAQVAYDATRQQEPVRVQEAEARLEDARQQLDALRNPGPAALAEAQADVDSARARLEQLRQGGTRADITAAEAQVTQSRASLEALSAPAPESEQAQAQAQVAQAEASLAAAQLKLDQATITAPFAGVVASVDISAGEGVGSGAQAFELIDRSSLYLDINLSESEIVRVAAGQPVTLSFDMLEGQSFKGTVQSVGETGAENQGIVTYLVTVAFDPGDAPVKVGMTAGVQILVERHQNVFQVPNRAITRRGELRTIEVLFGDGQDVVTVAVETGATNGSMTEIVRCLDTGGQCLRRGDQVRIELPAAPGANAGGPGGMPLVMPAGPAAAPRGPVLITRP